MAMVRVLTKLVLMVAAVIEDFKKIHSEDVKVSWNTNVLY